MWQCVNREGLEGYWEELMIGKNEAGSNMIRKEDACYRLPVLVSFPSESGATYGVDYHDVDNI